MKRITEVKPLPGFRVAITFADGMQGVADLSDLAGRGVFSTWNDCTVFEAVRIGDAGELVWPDGIDLCPDSLYLKITGRRVEDLFPILKHESVHA